MGKSPANDNAMPLSASARDWREGRRLRALELLAQGYRASDVARVLGVSAGAVSQWSKRARLGGAESLLRRKRRGRGPRLGREQLSELRALLTQLPQSHTGTTRKVAELIEKRWKIRYSRAQVSRILRSIGFSLSSRVGGTHLAADAPAAAPSSA